MEIKLDLHTHTSFSPHAYSTLLENVNIAAERGLEAIAMTNHGTATDDFSHIWHFANLKHIPRVINGVVVFTGVECSYIDEEATLDMPAERLEMMDIVIASKHGNQVCNEQNFTKVLLKAMDNPYIDILGHIARTSFTLKDEEYELIAKTAKEKEKLIELNESCFGTKVESHVVNARKLMLACKKYGTPIVVNTDAHFCSYVGSFKKAVECLKEIEFNEDLIMNSNLEKFMGYITKKKNIDMLRGE